MRLAARPYARWRLVCFAHAGGGPAAYRGWPNLLPDSIEVHGVLLPGHGARIKEPPVAKLDGLVRELAPALFELCDQPVALFGHSVGALLALEVARAWRRAFDFLPGHLFLSGCLAPQLPPAEPPIHGLPQPELIARLHAFNGTPPEVFANAELSKLVLPALVADLALAETYQYVEEPPLACPITALGGSDDPSVSASGLAGWRAHTSTAFAMRLFPGGHFYLREHEAPLVATVAAALLGD